MITDPGHIIRQNESSRAERVTFLRTNLLLETGPTGTIFAHTGGSRDNSVRRDHAEVQTWDRGTTEGARSENHRSTHFS